MDITGMHNHKNISVIENLILEVHQIQHESNQSKVTSIVFISQNVPTSKVQNEEENYSKIPYRSGILV